MDKQIVVYPFNWTLFSKEKEWANDTQHPMREYQNNYVTWKNSDKRVHTVCFYLYRIPENTNSSIVTENRLVVICGWGGQRRGGWRTGRGGMEKLEGGMRKLWGCVHVHDFDSNDGFLGVYVKQCQSIHIKYVQFIVYHNFLFFIIYQNLSIKLL